MEERTCYILQILLNMDSDYISAKQISDILVLKYNLICDIKTIYSDIKKINQYFLLIFHIEQFIQVKHRCGYFIEENILNDGELRFIYDTIISSRALSIEEGDQLFSKLLTLSSKKQIERVVKEEGRRINNSMLFTKLNTIILAIDKQKTIAFEYTRPHLTSNGQIVYQKSNNGNYKDHVHLYQISPYEVMIDSGKYYLLGYSLKRPGQLSIYRIDRMEKVRTTKEPYEDIREMFDMEQLKKQAVNMYFSNEIIQFKFLFKPQILANIIDQFGPMVHITKDNTGKFVGEVHDLTCSDGLIGWIMMLGDYITVLEPQFLKMKVIERLNRAITNYQW